jgi:hypothetical protein
MGDLSPATEAPRPGILCPGCGNLLGSVLFTRPVANQILRVRKCANCHRRVRTSERIVCSNSPGRGDLPSKCAQHLQPDSH